jgi:putative ABC transport system permease protein
MKLWNRIRHFTRRRDVKHELEEEMQAHRAMKEDRLQRDGMSRQEAREAAARSFGNMTLALEDSRGAWNFAWLESLGQDIRYATRCFRNAPLFSLTVILTMGLALGLNTILFTAFNAYVLAPFAVQDPYNLYAIAWNTKANSGGAFSWDEFQDLRRNSTTAQNNSAFLDFLAIMRANARVNGETLKGELVSGNYFSMLGVSPEIGRTIIPSDAGAPGANAVIVLTYAAWKSKFQEDPSVVGRAILLRGRPFEIVGVARRGFAGINNAPPDFWAPVTMYNQMVNGADFFGPQHPRSVEIVGRVNPLFSLAQARASLLVMSKALTANYPAENKVINVILQSNATTFPLTLEIIQAVLPAVAALGLILLLACANIANMMLARAMARQREIGLRLAIGASRARLIRQLLTEGFVLAVPAAGLGFCIAWLGIVLGTKAFFAIIPSEFASQIRVVPIHLDWRVFTFVLTAGCISTLAFALVPAIQATRGDLIRVTRGEFTGRHRAGRLRDVLVAAQVTICVMLLISSGILLRGSHYVESVDVGLDVRNVIEIDTRPDLRTKVTAILASNPSVESQADVWITPLYGFVRTIPIATELQPDFIYAGYNFVSPEYFDVFRIPIERGRNFTIEEARTESPVIVISETAARKFWPMGNALGETLRVKTSTRIADRDDVSPQFRTARVIGIARNAASDGGTLGVDKGCVYFPLNASATADYPLLVRIRGNTELVRRSLDQTLSNLVPGAVTQMIPMEQVIQIRYLPYRAFAWLSESLGTLAMALTAVGIYGVIAYLVTQRSKEIGIRIALGASARSVVRLVLSGSLRLAAMGGAAGMAIAAAVARILGTSMGILKIFDVRVYAVSVAIVLAAAALAAAIPARRASKLNPMSILRHE